MTKTFNMEILQKSLENMGFKTIEWEEGWEIEDTFKARMTTNRGDITVTASRGEIVQIVKPNGTRKYYYECTNAQIAQYVRQTMSYYVK